MKRIPLSKGMFALVDDDDFEKFGGLKWCASHESRGYKYYAVRKVRFRHGGQQFKIRLHREIMGLGTGFDDPRIVDHLLKCRLGIEHAGTEDDPLHTGDGLDCRKCGLEIIDQDENMRRSPGWVARKKKVEEPCL